jgi:hypothetical protein
VVAALPMTLLAGTATAAEVGLAYLALAVVAGRPVLRYSSG